jgi:transposase
MGAIGGAPVSRPADRPVFSPEELEELKQWAAPSGIHKIARRAEIILYSHGGKSDVEISTMVNLGVAAVGRWRRGYIKDGIKGLLDAPRKGRPMVYNNHDLNIDICALLRGGPPEGQARWTGYSIAAKLGVSSDKVYRQLKAEKIKLGNPRKWCGSNDPEFKAKAKDITKLYTRPPKGSVVLCVEEKPSIQAREMETGFVRTKGGMTVAAEGDRYFRHGYVNLFAAYDTQKGTVTFQITERKRRVGFLEFMEEVVERYPGQDIHVILDNLITHKNCDAFLEKHPQVHFHFTPTNASWLNQVEIWFSKFERQSLRGASFKSREALIRHIIAYITSYNTDPITINWTKKVVYGTKIQNYVRN